MEYRREWDDELKEMNRGKAGRPFKYSNAMTTSVAMCGVLLGMGYIATGFAVDGGGRELEKAGIKIELRADGGYGGGETLVFLAALDVVPVIKVRVNSNARAGGVNRARRGPRPAGREGQLHGQGSEPHGKRAQGRLEGMEKGH